MIRARRLAALPRHSVAHAGARAPTSALTLCQPAATPASASAMATPATSRSMVTLRLPLRLPLASQSSRLLPRIAWQSRSKSSSSNEATVLSTEQQEQLTAYMDELTACRDNGKWRQALKLLDRMDREGFQLDAPMYELAIASCARMGKIDVLGGLLQNMRSDSLVPTSRTVDFVMQGYIAAEEWQPIVMLARNASAQGVVLSEAAFEAAFEACGKMHDAHSARKILMNMEKAADKSEANALARAGISTTELYSAAIRACGMGGRADHAASLFAFMEGRHGQIADADVFNQVIRAQIVNGALPQALQTFAVVKERGLEMPESIYTATIDALIHRGEYRSAVRLFDEVVREQQLEPSVFCYGRMMFAYVRLARHAEAWACWTRIQELEEESPNLTKYGKMVEQLATTNASELAVDVFEFMMQCFNHAYIRDSTFAGAIRAYGRLGHTQTALDLFDLFVASRERSRRALPNSAAIYLAVFNALSRDTQREPGDNSRDAQRVWDIMSQHVPVLGAPAYASLANVLASAGDLETLDELLRHAAEEGFQQEEEEADDEDHYNSNDVVELVDATAPIAPLGRAMTGGHRGRGRRSASPRASNWHHELMLIGVISGFSKARSDQSERVVAYIALMQELGMSINDSVVRASTDTFIRHAHWDHMTALLAAVDPKTLQNAELTFGDTVSKLLAARAWEPARHWIAHAHRMGLQIPIRGKKETVERLQQDGSDEWQIAYALARETLNFRRMVQANIDSVANAMDVCASAGRPDLVVKMFERVVSHASFVRSTAFVNANANNANDQHETMVTAAEDGPDQHQPPVGMPLLEIPLRMFKQTLLACMRQHTTTEAASRANIEKAEAICAQMLEASAGTLTLDHEALSMAISIKATMRDDDDVVALFEMMQAHGFEPNSYGYNAAIMAYSRAKQLDRVVAIRDSLHAQQSEILQEPKVVQSLLFSFAILADEEAMTRHIRDTQRLLPLATDDVVLDAYLHANRLDKVVEMLDESVPDKVFYQTLRRALESEDPSEFALSAQLLLKFVALHGVDRVQPPGLILRTTKQLIAHGLLRESHAILSLLMRPDCEVALTDMKASFQREVLEMLLYIHGEQRDLTALASLLETQHTRPSHVALTVRHFQLAMEYCSGSNPSIQATSNNTNGNEMTSANASHHHHHQQLSVDDRAEGARACLKLFETLRQQFINPNGPVYLLALQSCMALNRLKSSGKRVVRDAVAQGCERPLSSELFRLANLAVYERKRANAVHQVNVSELATLTLFCHHEGVLVSGRLAAKMLELRDQLPVSAVNELEYIVSQAPRPSGSSSSSPRTPRSPKMAPSRAETTTHAAGARWGELYLQRIGSDK